MSKKAILEINGQKHEFPTYIGSENEVAIDISTLRAVTGGVTTIDPGFKNTGSCVSEITFLDGEKGCVCVCVCVYVCVLVCVCVVPWVRELD